MITVYFSKDGWRWHAKSGGRIVSESGEGYYGRRHCIRMALRYGPP